MCVFPSCLLYTVTDSGHHFAYSSCTQLQRDQIELASCVSCSKSLYLSCPIHRLGCWLDSFLLIELVLAEALWASPSDVIAVCIVISSNWVLTGKCKRCPTIPDWLLNCKVCECEPCRITITTRTTQPLLCSQRNWEMLTHSSPYYPFTLSRSLCIHLRNTVIE